MTGRRDAHATFGRNLATRRHARGWTQHQAAHAAGVGRATLARAEQGHPVTLDTALAIARAFGTTIDTLLTGEPQP